MCLRVCLVCVSTLFDHIYTPPTQRGPCREIPGCGEPERYGKARKPYLPGTQSSPPKVVY